MEGSSQFHKVAPFCTEHLVLLCIDLVPVIGFFKPRVVLERLVDPSTARQFLAGISRRSYLEKPRLMTDE